MNDRLRQEKMYNSFQGMHIRCKYPSQSGYARYGGRGIKVCEHWNSFINFYVDMKDTWFEGGTISRKDHDKNYEKSNCEWKPRKDNTKPLKYPIYEMLALYENGLSQRKIAAQYGTDQQHVSKLIQRAKRGEEF